MMKLQYIPLFAVLVMITSAAPIGLKTGHAGMEMRRKAQWGGKLANYLSYQILPVPYVIVHHTATTATCENFVQCAEILVHMQKYHMNTLNYDDIAYNFLIGNDGVVYEGRGWGIASTHASGYNTNSISIAFIGDFQKNLPAPLALTAAKRLLAHGIKKGVLLDDYVLFSSLQVIETQRPELALYEVVQTWPHWSPVP